MSVAVWFSPVLQAPISRLVDFRHNHGHEMFALLHLDGQETTRNLVGNGRSTKVVSPKLVGA